MSLGFVFESFNPQDLVGLKVNYTSYGATLKYYLAPFIFNSGWVGGLSLGKVSTSISISVPGFDIPSVTADGTYYGANFGYHWFWDYFNLFLGANVKNSSLPSETKTTSSTGFGTSTTTTKFTSTSGTSSGLEFSIGLKF